MNSIIVLEETTSTNDFLKVLLSNFKPQRDFTAIMAKYQTQGRGQRGTVWHSGKAQNLMASFAYHPKCIAVADQFIVSALASLAVHATAELYTSQRAHIKWPNDIMVGDHKIAGILIENKISGMHLRNSMIGIGLNVNQKEFPADIQHKTTSLAAASATIPPPLIDIVQTIQHYLSKYADLLTTKGATALLELYNDHLFRKDIPSIFQIKGQKVAGTITAVEIDGLLQVKTDGSIKKFDLKSIVYQL